MRIALALFAAWPAVAFVPMPSDEGDVSLRAISFNIRYDNPGDVDDPWTDRRGRIASLLRFHEADIVGLQEALIGQVKDLARALPEFAWVGVGRDDGVEAGEFSPIFFRKSRFELGASGTFWLSSTPDQEGSVGWDAALPRIATWAELVDVRTRATLFVLSTHFDHVGVQARERSAGLVRDLVRELAGNHPIVAMGDFNFTPESDAYRAIVADVEPGNPHLRDSRALVDGGGYGAAGTFSGFDAGRQVGDRIDFVFLRGAFHVHRHAHLTDSFFARFPSDHLPVFVELELSASARGEPK